MCKEQRESIRPLTIYVGPEDGVHCVIEEYEVTRMCRDMKRQGWAIKNSTCYINITLSTYTTMRQKKGKCKENIESVGLLTSYDSPRYRGHGVMEGYEQTWMGSKQ